jgi:hypothetical protein
MVIVWAALLAISMVVIPAGESDYSWRVFYACIMLGWALPIACANYIASNYVEPPAVKYYRLIALAFVSAIFSQIGLVEFWFVGWNRPYLPSLVVLGEYITFLDLILWEIWFLASNGWRFLPSDPK